MILSYRGIKINYKEKGEGTVIVFLHGFLENLNMWENTIQHFSKTHKCIAIDLLGHGKTDCIGYIHTMNDMALAVKEVLNSLNIKKVTLVGHSMGGYVAMEFLHLFIDFVSGLVLLNSSSLPDSTSRKINRGRAIEIVKKNPNAYTSMAIANLFAEENRIKHTKQIIEIKNQASETSLQGIISALEGMKIRKNHQETLTNYTGRKIFFLGTKDSVLPYTKGMQEAKKCNTNVISFNGGHMTHLENKKDYITALQNFLKTTYSFHKKDD